MKRTRHQDAKPALELVEEGVHLLRAAPASCLAAYYLGSVPFLMGLLFFWADMSRSAFAAYHTVEAALGMALLFLWMKTWQAIFARRLRVVLSGHERKPLGAGEIARVSISQAAVHSVGLFVVPLSLVAVIPFGWVFAFCQNATALAEDGLDGMPRFSTKLFRHAALWPHQNHALLLALFGFGLMVFLNWTSVCLALPFLAKTLFGIESIYTRSVFSLLNTTFFAAMFGLTYLAVDPLVKAVYVLRCFYGDSLKSGEDVRGELMQLMMRATPKRLAAIAILLAATVAPGEVGFANGLESTDHEAQAPGSTNYIGISLTRGEDMRHDSGTRFGAYRGVETTVEPVVQGRLGPVAFLGGATTGQQVAESVPSEELEKAIRETVRKRKYAWRMPRDKAPEKPAEQSILGRFFEKVGDMMQEALKKVGRWIENFLRGLFQGQTRTRTGTSGYNWVATLQMLAYFLIAVVVGAAIWLLVRYWRGGRSRMISVSSTPIEPAPDLTDENVGADQLPEDGWVRLGRELLEQGEFRLALRAFYLASLAHLAERNLVSLAKFKSNRDYQKELQRRAHAFPEVAGVFGENVGVFDRVWYGMYPVDAETVSAFVANVQRLKGAGA
jgi:hypothetical protein